MVAAFPWEVERRRSSTAPSPTIRLIQTTTAPVLAVVFTYRLEQ
jgi:hypothetical protein